MFYFLRFSNIVLVSLFVIPQAAHAGVLFSMVFDQANYSVSQNGTVDVNVFLRQTGIPDLGEFNVLGGADAVGMTGTGVRVLFGTGENDAQVANIGDISGNSAFDNFGFGPYTELNVGSAILSQVIGFNSPVFGSGAPDTYDLLLGTFTFTAGGVAGHMTSIGASIPLVPFSSDNVAGTSPLPTVLLNISNASATITVVGNGSTIVPEPTSALVWLCGSGLIIGLVSRRRAALSHA